eukprot:PhM_4_TR15917/c0_g1_i1/m.26253
MKQSSAAVAERQLQYGADISLRCLIRKVPYSLTSAGFADRRLLLRQTEPMSTMLGYDRAVFVVENVESDGGQQHPQGNRSVLLGTSIVLRHKFSDLVLAVQRRDTAALDRNCCVATLLERDRAGTACRFRVMPRYKMRHLGEVIHYGDETVLQLEGTDMFLHVTTTANEYGEVGTSVKSHLQWALETSMEVNCGEEPASWIVARHYAPLPTKHVERESKAPLLCGNLVRIVQSETERSMWCVPAGAKNNNNGSSSQTNASPNSSPEHKAAQPPPSGDDAEDAMALEATQTCTPPTMFRPPPLFSPGGQHPFGGGTAYPISFATDEAIGNCMSLWTIEYENPTKGGVVVVKEGYRVRHAASGRYLRGLFRGDTWVLELTPPTEDEIVLQETLFTFQHVASASADEDARLHLQTSHVYLRHAQSGMFVCSDDGTSKQTVLSARCNILDAMCFHHYSTEASTTFRRFLSLSEQLRLHCAHFSDLAELFRIDQATPADLHSKVTKSVLSLASSALASFILHCTNSVESDPLEREGLPVTEHQHMLYDLGIDRLLFSVATYPFALKGTARLFKPGEKMMLHGGIANLDDLTKPENAELHRVCRLVFRLIKQLCKGNPRFCIRFADWVPFMMMLEGYKLHIADTLLEIFSNGAAIDEVLSKTVADHFLRLLTTKSRSSGYLKFLANMALVPSTQHEIYSLLFSSGHMAPDGGDIVLRVAQDDDGGVSVLVPNKKGGGAKPLPVHKFLREGEAKVVKFFATSMELYAALCNKSACVQALATVSAILPRGVLTALLALGEGDKDDPAAVSTPLPLINTIKTSALRLLVNLYITPDLDTARASPNGLVVLQNIPRCGNVIAPLPPHSLAFLDTVKSLGLRRLTCCAKQVYDEKDVNEATTAWVRVWHCLVKEQNVQYDGLVSLVNVLLDVADGKSDMPTRGVEAPEGFSPSALTEDSNVLFECKAEICSLLRTIVRNAVVKAAEEVLVTLLDEKSKESNPRSIADEVIAAHQKDLHDNVLQLSDRGFNIVLNLAQNESTVLTNEALGFLVDVCSFRVEVLKLVKDTHILRHELSPSTYDAVSTATTTLLTFNLSPHAVPHESVKAALNDLLAIYEGSCTELAEETTPLVALQAHCSPTKPTDGDRTPAQRRWGLIRTLVHTSAFSRVVQRQREGRRSHTAPTVWDEFNMIMTHWGLDTVLQDLAKSTQAQLDEHGDIYDKTIELLSFYSTTPECAQRLTGAMHLLLDGLEIAGSSERALRTLVSIFANDGGITVSKDIVRRFVAYVGVDHSSDELLFDSLEHMVYHKYPHPANQRAVFNAFWDLGKADSITRVSTSWKSHDLMMNSRTVTLLMKCCLGNTVTRTFARRLLPSETILDVLSQSPPLPLLHLVPYIQFLGVVYFAFDSDMPRHEVLGTQQSWTSNTEWWGVITESARVVLKRHSIAVLFSTEALLPVIQHFFCIMFHPATAVRNARIRQAICTLCSMLAAGHRVARQGTPLHAALTETLEIIGQHKERLRIPDSCFVACGSFVGSEVASDASGANTPRFLRRESGRCLKSEQPQLMAPDDSPESKTAANDDDGDGSVVRLTTLQEALKGSERDGGLDPVPDDFENLTEAIGSNAVTGTFLRKIVRHVGGETESERLSGPTQLGILRAMRFDLERHSGDDADDGNEELMIEAQNRYDLHGLTPVLMALMASHNDDILNNVLQVGIAILEGGNANVQRTLLEYFTTTEEVFFVRVQQLIETARSQATQLENARVVAQRFNICDGDLRAEYRMIQPLFRFVQLMCEGHNLDMQNYIAHQFDNLHSVNTLREVLNLLQDMVGSTVVTSTVIDVLKQTFALLTEVCQGPCRGNQFILVQNNVCGYIHAVLTGANFALTGDDADRDANLQELKSASVTTLLALLEGCTEHYIPSVMLQQVPVDDLAALIEEVAAEAVTAGAGGDEDNEEGADDREELMYNLMILLHQVNSFNRFITDAEAVKNLQDALRRFEQFSKMIGRIEIQRGESLEAVFFRIPSICMRLTDESKEALQWAVDRSTQSSKLTDFVDKSDDLIYEMEHYYHVECVGKKHIRRDLLPVLLATGLWENAMMIWAFAATFVALIVGHDTTAGYWASIFIAFVLTIVTTHLVALDAILNAPLDVYKRRKELEVESLSWVELGYVCARRGGMWHRLVFWLFAVAGLVVSPHALAFHLLIIVQKSTILQNVTTAITTNGKSLLLTAILGMVMAYLFSIVGYVNFRGDFDAEGAQEVARVVGVHPENGTEIIETVLAPTCATLQQCFVHIATAGIRNGGGVGDVMRGTNWFEPNYVARTVFDFAFWVVMIIIFLNILFGIILDTFAELRDDRNKKEEDMRTICFICGLEASSLERQGVQFSHHCVVEHNVWNYLYFMHHLQRKEKDDYTGQESYVCEKLSENDINFFPSGTCLSLHARGGNGSGDKADDENNATGKVASGAGVGGLGLLDDEEAEERLSSIVQDAIANSVAMMGGAGVPTSNNNNSSNGNNNNTINGSTPNDVALLHATWGRSNSVTAATSPRVGGGRRLPGGAGSPRQHVAQANSMLQQQNQALRSELSQMQTQHEEMLLEIERLRSKVAAASSPMMMMNGGVHDDADGNTARHAELYDLAVECARLVQQQR